MSMPPELAPATTTPMVTSAAEEPDELDPPARPHCEHVPRGVAERGRENEGERDSTHRVRVTCGNLDDSAATKAIPTLPVSAASSANAVEKPASWRTAPAA